MGRLAEIQWSDVEKLGAALCKKFPERNPLRVALHELADLVQRLPRFRGAPDPGNPKLLEAVRRAWAEEFEEKDESELGR